MTTLNKNLVVLCILDGWGIASEGPGNAIAQAKKPNFQKLWSSFPHTMLSASGEAVGLPRGEVGNTETGHLNIGAGTIVYQYLPRINMSIAEGSFFQNPKFFSAINYAKKLNSNLHIMGLIGAGGVHSDISHLYALLRLCREQNFDRVYLHLFTDGRDSPTTLASTYIQDLEKVIEKEGVGKIASIMGRYWSMDRDFNWERTEKAYDALTSGKGNLVKTPEEAIKKSYEQGKTDEFIEPSIILDNSGKITALISDNDAVIFFNFRIDRPRQLTKALIYGDFEKQEGEEKEFDPYAVKYYQKHEVQVVKKPVFKRKKVLSNLYFVVMTQYSESIVRAGAKVAFPPEVVELPIGRVLSERGLVQLRATESEKERFVTYYFDGQRSQSFTGSEKLIVRSPAVKTYDLKPEMSSSELTKAVTDNIRTNSSLNFVVINYPNPDMVGHTGNVAATIKAIDAVDESIGILWSVISSVDGTLIITADHGNAEEMIDSTSGSIETEHSQNPVPFIIASNKLLGNSVTLPTGILADISPTILAVMGIEKPSTMTGRNLLSLNL